MSTSAYIGKIAEVQIVVGNNGRLKYSVNVFMPSSGNTLRGVEFIFPKGLQYYPEIDDLVEVSIRGSGEYICQLKGANYNERLNAGDVAFGRFDDEVEIRVTKQGITIVGPNVNVISDNVSVVADNVDVEAGQVNIAAPMTNIVGNVVVDGTITATNVIGTTDTTGGGISLKTHIHKTNAPAGSDTNPPLA